MRLKAFTCAAVIALTTCLAVAQEGAVTAALPTFEVASIKPTPPVTNGVFMMRMGSDPGMVTYQGVSLKQIIARAYGLKDYQIIGPSWIESTRFDVSAKVPEGTPKDKVPLMLQALLAERFKMVTHREEKDFPVYALIQGKGGVKMASAPDPSTQTKDVPGGGSTSVSSGGSKGGDGAPGQSFRINSSGGSGASVGGGAVMVSSGGGGAGGSGGPRRVVMGGLGHFETDAATMDNLCTILGFNLDRPVVDMTELKGWYKMKLDYKPEPGRSGLGMKMAAMQGGGVAVSSGGGGGAPAASSDDEPAGPSVFQAVQDQLGLKLDPRKAPLTTLVIDSLEKTPTEN